MGVEKERPPLRNECRYGRSEASSLAVPLPKRMRLNNPEVSGSWNGRQVSGPGRAPEHNEVREL
jgi:hypothetical protein